MPPRRAQRGCPNCQIALSTTLFDAEHSVILYE